ncbi:PQQ-dependent sugar dehydrogenase [Schlegelella sp. ID0723]|uniref:PQQ-dependent sugar dehydrogenase n=2 Tax=Piscinibacter koreensis TaxID=2742824 RepID=A0A7Y6NJN6_9BURK|nr:PQQ-dependent sugar dehydrogenase [Schlegelella koreensis]
MPRRMLEVAPNRFWVVDMGSWEPNQGRLIELRVGQVGDAGPRAQTRVLLDRLDRPFGMVGAPDGRIYVAEASRVWRLAPGAPLRPDAVIDGLPADGAHPLKEIVFGGPGRLFIGVGSATDACRDAAGRQTLPCPEMSGERPRAAVYEALLAGPRQTLHSLRPFATGLRNSLALAWLPQTRTLLQGENSIDYPDAGAPPEELNLLRDGADYGWPACVGARRPARGYADPPCARTTAPLKLWPAHAAPLHALALPTEHRSPFAGQLLVAWHGHRAAGHRVVGFPLDADGVPSGAPIEWLRERPRSRGGAFAPAGVAVAMSGALLVADDRNRRILMLVRER